MAPKPSFDKDELIRVLRDHPEWSRYEVARALTRYNFENGRQVVVNVQTVHNAVHKLRDELESMGIHAATRRNTESPLIAALKRNTGHRELSTAQNQNSLILRRLRQVSRRYSGLRIENQAEDAKAQTWEESLRLSRQVVDITDDGVPYLRPADRHELDNDGNLPEGGEGLITKPSSRR